jgi:hypothetical protein
LGVAGSEPLLVGVIGSPAPLVRAGICTLPSARFALDFALDAMFFMAT